MSRRSKRCRRCSRPCPRSHASIPLSMPRSRRSPPASRCRKNSGKPACGAMASMACPTKRSCMPCPRVAGGIPSRLVIAHLGNGASMAAIRDGKCVATTMGFSTLDGLVMGTRPGAIDPGALLHLLRDGMTREELERLLYHESGVKGVSGLTADMKTLLESADPEGEARHRSLLLSDRARAGLAGRRARRARCAGLHRRRRRERDGDPRAGVRGCGVAGAAAGR